MLIPFVNLVLLTCLFGTTTLLLLTPLAWSLLLYQRITHKDPYLRPRTSVALTALFNGVPPMLLAISIVVSVEQTIHANQVGPGESQWTLGQTLAMFVSWIPVWDIARWIYEGVGQKLPNPGEPRLDSVLESTLNVLRAGPARKPVPPITLACILRPQHRKISLSPVRGYRPPFPLPHFVPPP